MKTDWNGDGKHDWTDDYMDYKLSTSNNDSTSSDILRSSGKAGAPTRVPTWGLIVILLGIVSGELPINGVTVIIAVVISITIWIRLIS